MHVRKSARRRVVRTRGREMYVCIGECAPAGGWLPVCQLYAPIEQVDILAMLVPKLLRVNDVRVRVALERKLICKISASWIVRDAGGRAAVRRRCALLAREGEKLLANEENKLMVTLPWGLSSTGSRGLFAAVELARSTGLAEQ